MPEANSTPFPSNQARQNPVYEPEAAPKPKLLERLEFAALWTGCKV